MVWYIQYGEQYEVLKKLKRKQPYYSSNPLLDIVKGSEIGLSKRHLHSCTYYITIHSTLDMESTEVFISG
jgi:hypothetical protein